MEHKEKIKQIFPTMKVLYPNLKTIYGPYLNSDNRRFVVLYFENLSKISTAYSRIILEANIGRRLVGDETCDHIDGDVQNDSIENLQILTFSENSKKGPKESTKLKMAKETSISMRGNNRAPKGQDNNLAKLTEKEVIEIKEYQKNNYRGQDKVLAERYNVGRATIKAIRLGYTWKHI
jgi:hypothetical protein